jgi:hypothetical protein
MRVYNYSETGADRLAAEKVSASRLTFRPASKPGATREVAVEIQTDWTQVPTRQLRSELAKREKALQRLVEAFPELEGSDTRILMRGLTDFTRGGEWAEFDRLRSEIRAFKLELFRRDARMPDRAAEPSKSTAKPEPSPVLATESRLQRRLAILDMLATEKQTDNRNMGVPQSKSAKQSPIFTHSDDYRSVNMRGKSYALTSRQAQMIESLHSAHESGNADVSIDGLLEKIGTPNSRWQDTFKSNPEAKKALIKSGERRKGTLRLNL